MAITIVIPTPLRQFAGGKSEIEVQAATAGEALKQLTAEHGELRKHLYNEQDSLRNFINVYVGDEDIRHLDGADTQVKDGETILIVRLLPAAAQTPKPARQGHCRNLRRKNMHDIRGT
jgi:ThiS family.